MGMVCCRGVHVIISRAEGRYEAWTDSSQQSHRSLSTLPPAMLTSKRGGTSVDTAGPRPNYLLCPRRQRPRHLHVRTFGDVAVLRFPVLVELVASFTEIN
jgi:protocatechuate 3,4-dioxygenase beta subunit